ncbi:MAG TPA: hypothetical protein VF956_12355 [Candidatus Dormibacteraeota bacterium]
MDVEVQGQVVDTETAQEFMRQALEMLQLPEMEGIARELELKSRRFQEVLAPTLLAELPDEGLHRLLRSIFATRRRAAEVIATIGANALRTELTELLHGREHIAARIDRFDDALAAIEPPIRRDIAGEALHFYDPDRHWMWTRWMWDPDLKTGALPLVTMQDFDLQGLSAGQTYLKVGTAIAFVNQTGRAVGFTRYGSEAFGIDVYLACVYGIYLYTITRLRMTQEFNKVIPPLPQLVRRLLGTHRMEI